MFPGTPGAEAERERKSSKFTRVYMCQVRNCVCECVFRVGVGLCLCLWVFFKCFV